MVEGQQFLTYMIALLDLNYVQLRSGRILENGKPSIDIQEQDASEEDSLKVNKSSEGTSFQNQNIQKQKQKESINTTPIIEQPTYTSTPPFPERLQIDRRVEKQILMPNYDFIDKFKNVCINILLLQAIREIPF